MRVTPAAGALPTADLASGTEETQTSGMPEVSDVASSAQSVADSRPMGWLARIGLTARGCVYLLIGWLAILVGLGGRAHVDQRGALTEVIAQPFGSLLVVALAFGFAAYALWRMSEAVTGVTGDGDGAGARIQSLARAIVYGFLAATAVSLLRGARGTQSGQQGHLAGQVMSQPGGRWLVGIVGLVVVAVGAIMIRDGWSEKFLALLRMDPDEGTRLGDLDNTGCGAIARGVVFAVTGVLVVVAAWTADPTKAGGIDEAIRTLLDRPYGPALVVGLGLGLVVFGVYGLAEARWRHVTDPRRDEPARDVPTAGPACCRLAPDRRWPAAGTGAGSRGLADRQASLPRR